MPKTKVPVFKPSQVLRLVKAGKMPDAIKGGRHVCGGCGHKDMTCETNTPSYHSNGGYIRCGKCRRLCLYVAVFPACEGYPLGFRIDCSGERTKYPVTLSEPRRPDKYKLTVVFTRLHSEDDETVEGKFPGKLLGEKLRLQLSEELQEACERMDIAGEFEVLPYKKGK